MFHGDEAEQEQRDDGGGGQRQCGRPPMNRIDDGEAGEQRQQRLNRDDGHQPVGYGKDRFQKQGIDRRPDAEARPLAGADLLGGEEIRAGIRMNAGYRVVDEEPRAICRERDNQHAGSQGYGGR